MNLRTPLKLFITASTGACQRNFLLRTSTFLYITGVSALDIKRCTECCKTWKGGRVVEGARLESVFTLAGNKGSNPFPSAIICINI